MEGEIPRSLIALHAAYVICGFALMASGTAVARNPQWIREWLPVHRFLGVSGSAILGVGVIQAVIMVSLSGEEHFEVIHAYLGLLIAVLAVAVPAAGQLQLKSGDLAPGTTMRSLHVWPGRLILAFTAVNAFLGLVLL